MVYQIDIDIADVLDLVEVFLVLMTISLHHGLKILVHHILGICPVQVDNLSRSLSFLLLVSLQYLFDEWRQVRQVLRILTLNITDVDHIWLWWT